MGVKGKKVFSAHKNNEYTNHTFFYRNLFFMLKWTTFADFMGPD
jgi:hypothetical protein